MLEPKINLSPKQLLAIEHIDAPEKHFIAVGAVGSGKTVGCAAAHALFIATHPDSHRHYHAVVGNSQTTAVENVVEAHLGVRWWLHRLGFKTKKTREDNAPILRVFLDTDRTAKILLLGASNESSQGRIRGKTILSASVDEAVLIPESIQDMLFTRFRAEGAKTWSTTNPDIPDHHFKVNVMDNQKVSSKNVTYLMEDNPTMTPELKAELTGHLKGTAYERFVLGRWVAHTGLIFPIWSYGELQGPPLEWSLGFDWASDRGVIATTLFARYADCTIAVIDNKYDGMIQSPLTPSQHADRILRWLSDLMESEGISVNPLGLKMIGDPSTSVNFKDEVRLRGMEWINAKNDVDVGHKWTYDALGRKTYLIGGRAVNTIKSLKNYRWKPGPSPQKPLKDGFDHFADVLRYHAYTGIPSRYIKGVVRI